MWTKIALVFFLLIKKCKHGCFCQKGQHVIWESLEIDLSTLWLLHCDLLARCSTASTELIKPIWLVPREMHLSCTRAGY